MIDYFSIETLLTLLIGGIIGFLSSILIQRRLFKRQDKIKLAEEVYGKLYPLLLKGKIRHMPGEFEYAQWPGSFWLSTPEILEIDTILAKYSNLIPSQIKSLWFDAKKRGPQLEGPDDAESDEIWYVFDLEKILSEIEKEIKK